MVSGLAASIRSAAENETFDLGSQNATSITSTIQAAFREAFPLTKMIRITFVTGAGKQGRQKYDEGAAKAVISTLNSCGYREDRGASCVMECSGLYKQQHDTNKNLRTVVVFPKVVTADSENDSAAASHTEPLVPEDSPGHKIAISSMTVFTNMINSKCPSWSQKKGCLTCIQALSGVLRQIETHLVNGTPLTEPEQSFYDAVLNLGEKEAYVRQELQNHVEHGNLTKFEQALLLEHNAERIAALEKEGKATTKALERKELLESIDAVPPHKLRYEPELGKLRKELALLLKMEEDARGRLLTLKETQTLSRKDEVMEEIDYWEEASRGWFEDDAVFESRVRASREVFSNRAKKKADKALSIDAGTKVKTSVSKWILPGEKRGAKGMAKKRTKAKGAGVFSAMMMDSSSDEEEMSSEEEENEENADDDEVAGDAPDATVESAKKKSKKKKRKKAKSKQGIARSMEEATASPEEREEEQTTAVAQVGAFLQSYVLPLLVAFVGWLIASVFGKSKKRKAR